MAWYDEPTTTTKLKFTCEIDYDSTGMSGYELEEFINSIAVSRAKEMFAEYFNTVGEIKIKVEEKG